jgi:hypothetical protein
VPLIPLREFEAPILPHEWHRKGVNKQTNKHVGQEHLAAHSRSRLILDPAYLPEVAIPDYDWTDFYGDEVEPIPPDQPEPQGKAAQTTAFVDSDHAADLISRRSRTGVLIYPQSAH